MAITVRGRLAKILLQSPMAMIVEREDCNVAVYADEAVRRAIIAYLSNNDHDQLGTYVGYPWPSFAPPWGVVLSIEPGRRTAQKAQSFGLNSGVVFYVKA